MNYHQKMIDIYLGMANGVHIREILREAEIFKNKHPRHIITAMYYDMVGWYYDILADGSYVPYTEEEAEILQKEIDAMDMAIKEMELSSDSRKTKYLTKYYISMASILIRSVPDYYDEATDLLDKVYELIEENSDNHCYYCMVSAWYYTLAEPDIDKTRSLTEQAELLNCLLDVYMELQDLEKCRELIAEIDRINEVYKEQGVCREVSPEIREKAGS